VGDAKNRDSRSQVGRDEEQRRGQTMCAVTVGGMTLWAPVDKQAARKPRHSETTSGARLWAPAVWCSGERWLWAHAR
jgi:hypothetical protein